MYQNCPTEMQISKIFPGTIPCFRSPKIYQNSPIQQCRIHKYSGDNTPNSRFRGEESLFSFSKNVPKLSYSNAEFPPPPKNPGVEPPDPVFENGRGSCLPPLEIVSGYASGVKRWFLKTRINNRLMII